MKIKNAADFRKVDSKLNLKKISSDEIRITEIDDIWDGPLSGDCEWRNKKYYFYCFDQLDDTGNDDRWPRKYLLIELTSQQLAQNQKLRDLFQNWRKNSASPMEYQKMLEASPSQTIDANQIIGWFDSGDQKNAPSKFIESYFTWRKKNG